MLHCSVENSNGGGGEFYVRGRAIRSTDPLMREQAVRVSPYKPQDHYILFVLTVEFAFRKVYLDGKSNARSWQAAA